MCLFYASIHFDMQAERKKYCKSKLNEEQIYNNEPASGSNKTQLLLSTTIIFHNKPHIHTIAHCSLPSRSFWHSATVLPGCITQFRLHTQCNTPEHTTHMQNVAKCSNTNTSSATTAAP